MFSPNAPLQALQAIKMKQFLWKTTRHYGPRDIITLILYSSIMDFIYMYEEPMNGGWGDN